MVGGFRIMNEIRVVVRVCRNGVQRASGVWAMGNQVWRVAQTGPGKAVARRQLGCHCQHMERCKCTSSLPGKTRGFGLSVWAACVPRAKECAGRPNGASGARQTLLGDLSIILLFDQQTESTHSLSRSRNSHGNRRKIEK